MVFAYSIPAIEFKYIIITFILSVLLILINSFILTFIDLINPRIDWKAEYEILKNSKNKLLQYVLIILNILFLIYMDNIFIEFNLDKSLFVFTFLIILIFMILDFIIFKFQNKLFKKIN